MSWRRLYPFESKFATLPSGHRIHYVDEGSGRSLVFLHGNPTWSFHYRKLVDALRANYRVIALDHLGCGLSDKPRRYDYCLAQHTANTLDVLKRLEVVDATIVGHDWGGAIAVNAVRRAPRQFARIVLFNTGAFTPRRVPWRIAICRTPGCGPFAVRGLNVFVRAALRMTMVDPERLTPDERMGILAPYNNWADRIGVQRFIDDIPLTRRHRTWHELAQLEKALPGISIPKLLIWGIQDWCFDVDCLERFVRAWPDAHVVKFKDAGHWIVEEKSGPVARLIAQFASTDQVGSIPCIDGVSP